MTTPIVTEITHYTAADADDFIDEAPAGRPASDRPSVSARRLAAASSA